MELKCSHVAHGLVLLFQTAYYGYSIHRDRDTDDVQIQHTYYLVGNFSFGSEPRISVKSNNFLTTLGASKKNMFVHTSIPYVSNKKY